MKDHIAWYRLRYAEAFARFPVETLEAWVARRPAISARWDVPAEGKGDGERLIRMTQEVWTKQLGRKVNRGEAVRIIDSFANVTTVLPEIEEASK